MAKKVAKIRLKWSPSVSTDIKSQLVSVQIDGQTVAEFDLPPGAAELLVDVNASSSFMFTVNTTDNEGLSTISQAYAYTLGDLEAPQPATGLGHEILSVIEVPDEPVPLDI